MISYSDAKGLSRKGNIIPIFRRIAADLDTPLSVYLKLARRRRRSFLLESIEGGEKLGRYSFVGYDPFLAVYGLNDRTIVHSGRNKKTFEVDPIDFLDEMFRFYRPVKIHGMPRFTGGGVGYFAYDTIRWREKIPDANPDKAGLPPLFLAVYKNLIAFDHLRQEIIIIANLIIDKKKEFRNVYSKARQSIDIIEKRLKSPLKQKNRVIRHTGKIYPRAAYSRSEFESRVRNVKHYIKEGDIFQVVLSQSWQAESKVRPVNIYRGLRRINPSPYMFLLVDGDNSLIGSSPEMLVRIEDRKIETRPIAGTRPRGRHEAEDLRLEKELLADEKETAEHTMLLDLGRNDIGRVARAGTVRVNSSYQVERYSHVMHIVSSVEGRLKAGITPLKALYACFPAGTVSGAPKIRAMEIIDELEKHRRGVYAGAVGYIDFHGNLDSCIAIRTLVKKKDDIFIQAGAGIVADSVPRKEYDETRDKAEALKAAIDLAREIEIT